VRGLVFGSLFPPFLYQHFTEADLTRLRELGCDFRMTNLEEGLAATYKTLREIGH